MEKQEESFRIAMIDDNEIYLKHLQNNLDRYAKEHNCEFLVCSYTHAADFLADYAPNYDIIFMDVVMQELDGMAAAARIRKIDDKVNIIFVTNYGQYAIRGYEVRAFAYIIKPFLYGNFALTMDKVLWHCRTMEDQHFTLQTPNGIIRCPISKLLYIESKEHYLIFHTVNQDIRKRGKLSEVEDYWKKKGFCRCGVSFLVNLRCILKIENQSILLTSGEQLSISRRYKNEFLSGFAAFVGKEGVL